MREYSCPEEAAEAYEAQRVIEEEQAQLEAAGCAAEAEAEELIDGEAKG